VCRIIYQAFVGAILPCIGEERMKSIACRTLASLVLIPFLVYAALGAAETVAWQSGWVTGIELNSQSHDPKASGKPKPTDQWWTYSICNGVRTYSAAGRVSPAKLGLEVASPVKFSATTSQITLKDTRGKQYVMRIIRLIDSRDCAGR
jgi:hypothetical protein